MKTTLKELHDLMQTTDNTFAANTIKNHMMGLFYELTGNLEWDFADDINIEDDLYDNWSSDEVYICVDYDEVIVPDNDLDVCVRVKFNVDATQHMESDGMRFFENKNSDVLSIIFDYAGDEWDVTDDKTAKKFVYDIIGTWI